MCSAARCVLAVLCVCGLVTQTLASVPVNFLPFINYYEVYLEPYIPLMKRLTGPNSYAATLAMLGLVAAGTLGYLPVNLKDVANAIDSRKKSNNRRRYWPGGPPPLRRRLGWHAPAARRHRRWRRDTAARPDDETLRQLLSAVDPDMCLVRLICEAQFDGLQRTSSSTAEELLLHTLFGDRSARLLALPEAERASEWGRRAREDGSPSAHCELLTPRCQHSPLELVRRAGAQRTITGDATPVTSGSPLREETDNA